MEVLYVIGLSAAVSLATSLVVDAVKTWRRKRKLNALLTSVRLTKDEIELACKGAERQGFNLGLTAGPAPLGR